MSSNLCPWCHRPIRLPEEEVIVVRTKAGKDKTENGMVCKACPSSETVAQVGGEQYCTNCGHAKSIYSRRCSYSSFDYRCDWDKFPPVNPKNPPHAHGPENMRVGDMNNHLSIVRLELDRLESIDMKLNRLRRAANWLIYASVVLGVALLVQLYALAVPSWLFYSILVGWILYLAVAIGVAAGIERAYPPAIVLAIVTLAISLPQPEHYSLAEAGATVASLTFVTGSVLQVGVIILATSFLIQKRRQSRAVSRLN